MVLSRLFPAILWWLAVVDMFALVWQLDGIAFVVAFVAAAALSAAGAYGFIAWARSGLTLAFALTRGRVNDQEAARAVAVATSWQTRLAVQLFLFAGLVAAAWRVLPGWSAEPTASASVTVVTQPAAEFGEGVRLSEPALPPGPSRGAAIPANVLDLIPAAQQLLAVENLQVKFCGGKGHGEAACLCDYKLAVTDVSGRITLVDAYEGQETSSPPGYHVDVQITPGYERACGTNPILDVAHPPGQTVLAVRTVVKDGKRTTRAAVFTPFTDALNIPELRKKGLDYWWGTVTKAQADMRARNVPSAFRKGELVADVIPASHVFLLGIIENIGMLNPFGVTGTEADRTREFDAVLVMYGANGTQAFNWRVSSANARGPVQFTPHIYASLRRNYPAAELPEDFETGTADHAAAVRAAFLHSDEEFRPLSPDWRTALPRHPLLFGLYLAAGYNGNARRANRALDECSSAEWYGATCPILKQETIWYQRKYAAADAFFFQQKAQTRIVEEQAPAAESDDDDKTE